MRKNLKIEDSLDLAVQDLKNGSSLASVLSAYPETQREELTRLLAMTKLVKSIPIKYVPAPLKRRLFLQVEKKPAFAYRFIEFFTTFKTVVPTVVVVLILVLTGTVQAAKNSLPGDSLFTIRKAIEKTQVTLATNSQSKTNLELEFANARLQDAQKVIAKNSNDGSKEIAIAELKDQTNVALNNVKDNAPAASTSDPDLVKKLEELTKEQEALISKKDSSQQKTLVADIKRIVAVSKEESSASIAADTDIDVTGQISFISLKNSYIKIDKNSFQINDDTVIQDKDGNDWKITELGINDNVKIEGEVKDDSNNASKITILSRTKGKIEIKDPVKTETKPVIKTQPTPTPTPETQEPIEENPQDTFGGAIIEQPPAVSSF